MKKKFGLWLNIVTICLCMCAIAIGVYAATSATLTVSGQIGFKAHGCEGTVSGTIVGHAEGDDKDAMPTTTPEDLNDGNAVNFGQTLSYGTSRYFTDMATTDGSVTPITIVLTVTNKSLYPIEGQLVLPETDFAKAIDFDVESGLVQLAAATPADDNTDVGTITITMKLKETTTNYTTPIDLNFTVKFNKYAQLKHDEATGYHMTMGSNVVTDENDVQQVQPVKWIPFAESSDDTNWAPFDNANKPDLSKKYYYISEKVLDIGTTIMSGSGVSFNPYLDCNTRGDTREELSSQDANIYLTSNVRDLLQGEDAYKSAVLVDENIYAPDESIGKVNLFKEYGISGYLYDNILTRSAKDLHGATVPDALLTYNTNNDKLWLLSGEELKYLLKDMDFEYLISGTTSDQKAILKTQTLRQGVNSGWWLRSYVIGSYAWYVNALGSVEHNLVSFSDGVRPAFKI